ncbi:MAG: ribonuclease R, partial [Synergistales bacterium]|nr:ribonuclease R [Synergistales bacterium]
MKQSYPPTQVEILRVLYFSESSQNAVDLQNTLAMRDMPLDPRTVRYHLSSLEELGLIERSGKRRVELTEKGIEEAKMLFV